MPQPPRRRAADRNPEGRRHEDQKLDALTRDVAATRRDVQKVADSVDRLEARLQPLELDRGVELELDARRRLRAGARREAVAWSVAVAGGLVGLAGALEVLVV